jgi:hypothetical protein
MNPSDNNSRNKNSNATTATTNPTKNKSSSNKSRSRWVPHGLFGRRHDENQGAKHQQQNDSSSAAMAGLAVRAYVASHKDDPSVLSTSKSSNTTEVSRSQIILSNPSSASANQSRDTSNNNSNSQKWSVLKASHLQKPTTTTTHQPKKQETTTSTTNKTKKMNKTKKEVATVGNFLTRTKFFQEMLEWAFDQVDADGSGNVDEKELYSGLLLIHLKLGTYAGPAACKPISREQTHTLFEKADIDHSGTLDRDEFDAVMMILFGNALLRVAFQYAGTLLMVPLLAQQLLTALGWAYTRMGTLLLHYLLEQSITMGQAEEERGGGEARRNVLMVQEDDVWEILWDRTSTWLTRIGSHWMTQTPSWLSSSSLSSPWLSSLSIVIKDVMATIDQYIQAVPPSVWNSIPLTLISTILSMMLIPWTLMKIDDFFQSLADPKKKMKKEKKKGKTTIGHQPKPTM